MSEPDEAAKAMMSLKVAAAAADLSGAVDELAARTGRRLDRGRRLLHGRRARAARSRRTVPTRSRAVVPCYGVYPWAEGQPDYAAMTAAVQIHCARLDDVLPARPPPRRSPTRSARSAARSSSTSTTGVDHAFANEDRPEVFDAAAATLMFDRTVAFLAQHLA